jgi:hypothetical protein
LLFLLPVLLLLLLLLVALLLLCWRAVLGHGSSNVCSCNRRSCGNLVLLSVIGKGVIVPGASKLLLLLPTAIALAVPCAAPAGSPKCRCQDHGW